MSTRHVTGMVACLLALAGLDWPVPDYSTLCRRQKGLLVAIAHRPGATALHLRIDSTGIKAEGCGEWCAKKHGPSTPRQWRKVHRGIDAETLEIRAIEVTGAGVGDAPTGAGVGDAPTRAEVYGQANQATFPRYPAQNHRVRW